MRAMLLRAAGEPLEAADIEAPRPGPGELLISVEACGVCRTDLHVVDGELSEPKLPLVLGHQIVGTVVGLGVGVDPAHAGERVGVPWLGGTCGHCRYCQSDAENLCEQAVFTGYHRDGGFAELTVADQRYCFSLGRQAVAAEVAPLLCGGLIGYRALELCGPAECVGLYGFGSAAHMVAQIAQAQGRRVGAFTRAGDDAAQRFALDLGATWAVASTEPAPEPLDAAIIFAPVGALVVEALRNLRRGGTVVCAGIHMSDIPAFPYQLLWGERSIKSVANLTRRDGRELLSLAAELGVETRVCEYPLEAAGQALADLRAGRLDGSAVLVI